MSKPRYRVVRHPGAGAFLERAGGWLLRAEAEHNLLLGLAGRLRESTAGFQPPIYLATVEDDSGVVGCAFRTPPHKLGVTRLPLDAVPALVADVAEVYPEIPAVLGPEDEARAVAEAWGRRTGTAPRVGMRQRIHELERVIPPRRTPPGRARPATPDEVELVAEWTELFLREAGVQGTPGRELAERHLAAGELLVWEDGEPRAMAAAVGRTPNGVRVGYVFTPPEWRGRGYASALTAALSQRILERGFRFCFLYTDRANPTSNAIYAAIGYRPVCDVVDLLLEPPSPEGHQAIP